MGVKRPQEEKAEGRCSCLSSFSSFRALDSPLRFSEDGASRRGFEDVFRMLLEFLPLDYPTETRRQTWLRGTR